MLKHCEVECAFKRAVTWFTWRPDLGDLSVTRQKDVSGRCSTAYTVSEHGESRLITKRKDLLSCLGRGHLVSSLQSTPYTSGGEIQSLPLIK